MKYLVLVSKRLEGSFEVEADNQADAERLAFEKIDAINALEDEVECWDSDEVEFEGCEVLR